MIISDSKSLLAKITNITIAEGALLELAERLAEVSENHNIALAWTKGHAGTEGNERADELCAIAQDSPVEIDDEVTRNTIHSACLKEIPPEDDKYDAKKYKGRWSRFPLPPKKALNLPKVLLGLSLRIRSGHCRIDQHAFRLGITSEAPSCKWCNFPIPTIEHYLFDCEAIEVTRARFELHIEYLFEDTWVNRLFDVTPLQTQSRFFQIIQVDL